MTGDIDAMLDRLEIMTINRDDRWSEEEDGFLRENLGFVAEGEIAEELGRSVCAVHERWKRDLYLPAPSKDPRYITAHRLALALGIDGHTTVHWVDSGLLKGEMLPTIRRIRRVLLSDLVAWLLEPENWVYFKIEKVRHAGFRRLLEGRREEWGDDWWNTRQVAEYLGVEVGDVKRYLKLGRLRGRQVPNRGGRDPNPRWANWFILRSEATRPDLIIHRRKLNHR